MSIQRKASIPAVALLAAVALVSPAAGQEECQAAVKIVGQDLIEDEWGTFEHVVDFEIRISACKPGQYTSGKLEYKLIVKEPDSDDERVVGHGCDWPNEERHNFNLECRLSLDFGETVVGEIRPDDVYTYCYCL